MTLLSFQISEGMLARFQVLCEEVNESINTMGQQAIEKLIEDYEDIKAVKERLAAKDPNEKNIPITDIIREYGLANNI